MIRFLWLFSGATLALLFSGCVNDRGISARYYNDCHEYYDLHGYYHKECDKNLIEFKDVKKAFTPKEEKKNDTNVW